MGWRRGLSATRSLIVRVVRRFDEVQGFRIATSLMGTSVLSAVPLAAVLLGGLVQLPGFAELEASLREMLVDALVPEVGAIALGYVEEFVANAGQLTLVGSLSLLVTSLMLLNAVEAVFDDIWRVRLVRGVLRRFLWYAVLLLALPLVVLPIAGILLRGAVDAGWLGRAAWVLPIVFEVLGGTLLYAFAPNRPVKVVHAFAGACLASVGLELARPMFARMVGVGSNYETLYGSFWILPGLLFWIYLFWFMVLVGATLAAVLPDWMAERRLGMPVHALTPAQQLVAAVAVLSELEGDPASDRWRGMRTGPLKGSLAERDVIERLHRSRWIHHAHGRWWLAKDLDTVTLLELAKVLRVRMVPFEAGMPGLDGPWREPLDVLLRGLAEEERRRLCVSVKALLRGDATNLERVAEQCAPGGVRGEQRPQDREAEPGGEHPREG